MQCAPQDRWPPAHSVHGPCSLMIVPGPPPKVYTVPLHLGSVPTRPGQLFSEATQVSMGLGLPIAFAPQLCMWGGRAEQ